MYKPSTFLTRDEAFDEATQISQRENLQMVVLYEPFSEAPEGQNYNYCPAAAAHIFNLSEVVDLINPEDSEENS